MQIGCGGWVTICYPYISSSLYLLGALTVCKHTLVLHRDIAALAAIYGYLVALDLAYRKNIYCYNGNNSIIDNDRTIASSRRSREQKRYNIPC